ncbi:DUF1573 domain-containing protein [Lutibacter aestuarii]|uniref:DUF1573 domain-containing protein n=1 Tax=Lutibacter aestuarii TaxID=861111 RepID=A0ABW2Z9Q6_9FLAO|nr:DUF1573 domain-containing protein [uncultured Lutibacter sp.]
MKKITIICATLLSVVFISCNDSATKKIKSTNLETAKERDEIISLGGPVIEFDKMEFDFGTITEGEIIDGTFKISNTGKTDLLIINAKPSCGCTVPEWPKEPIKPGASAELKFSFNSNGRVGKQHKTITLQTNTEKVTEMLRIKGTVTAKNS